MNDMSQRRGVDRPALVVGLLLTGLAAIVLRDAFAQTMVATYGIGPKAMPLLIGGGLLLLAIGHFVVALREGLPRPDSADPVAIGWAVTGLLGLIGAIWLGAGFIIATAIVFAFIARAMGRRALLADLGIGFGLGIAIYLMFAKVLTLSLPMGPLERLI
jgi:putative tricarboxylic transport membrane protein